MTQEEERFTLHAYICGRDCVRTTDHIGALTFQQVYVERPAGCRFAVVENTSGEFLVWDLYSDEIPYLPPYTAPTPTRVTGDADSAIMATAILYDDGG